MAPPCVNQQGFSPFVIHRVPSPPSSSLSLFFIKPAIENRDWTILRMGLGSEVVRFAKPTRSYRRPSLVNRCRYNAVAAIRAC